MDSMPSVCVSRSDAVSPNEFLGDRAFWNVSHFVKEGSVLKLDIHAVAEAVVRFSDKCVLVHPEGVPRFTSARFEALERHEPHLLRKS